MLCVRRAPDFQLVVEPYEWGKAGPEGRGPLLRLHTPTAAAARLSLPAGRHVARLLTDPHSLYALDVRYNAPFHLEDLTKVLIPIHFIPQRGLLVGVRSQLRHVQIQ